MLSTRLPDRSVVFDLSEVVAREHRSRISDVVR